MKRPRPLPWLLVAATLGVPSGVAADAARVPLASGWRIQSSAKTAASGDRLSQPGFSEDGWYDVSVPNTVVGALVESGVYEDPYFGMNLRKIPGTTYPIGERFTNLPMPEDSPFFPSWWYRTGFEVPARMAGRSVFLHLDGINYRANVWVNGTRIANKQDVVGTFCRWEFDVTRLVRPGAANALAIEVFKPEPQDLAFMWVDWNPTPADKNMGVWGPVYLTDSGPIALRHPHVITDLDLPSLASARLSVTAEVWNTTDAPVSGTVRGALEAVQFARQVQLGPREHRTLRFTPEDVSGLVLQQPRIWWPYRMGKQDQYTLSLDAVVGGLLSDRQDVRFGVREYTSELTPEGHRLFKVNGKPILIRGGGWASDMMFRPPSLSRLEAQFRYVREMGLNTIRLEGKLETDLFFDLADEYGILLMPGWCCCSQWEKWAKWDEEDHRVGPASLHDQALRLRNHPSVLVWLNGSDYPPTADVERDYLDVLEKLEWQQPILSNATDAPGPVSGPSGVKMRGPYDYVPPRYWLNDSKKGGAFGFATEIGPGGAVPPIESLKRMLPADKLWPINEFWNFHAGGDEFKDLHLFTGALEGRYGPATSAEDYARKAQALAYEGERAMFEAYGRNRYTSTGVIQWMLNNAWPSMIWHLYDWYLRPGGGYFGTKSACEPVHVQYSYDDRSVVVVNDLQESFSGLSVEAQVLNLDASVRLSRKASLDVGPDSTARAFVLPAPKGLTTTYFVRLGLRDAGGRTLSRNFYWLSTRDDRLDWQDDSKWFYTPTQRHADLTALAKLPPTQLAVSARLEESGREGRARVSVQNTGKAIAFQVRLKLDDAESGQEVLPVYWQDNYLALLPGEKREIEARYPLPASGGRFRVEAQAWNAASVAN